MMSTVIALAACSNNSGQTGVQEDGDSAGRHNSTISTPADGTTDTSGAFGEDRVDTQKRDSM